MRAILYTTLAAGIVAAFVVAPALAQGKKVVNNENSKPPFSAPTQVGPENPCLDGHQWYPEKGICARKLASDTPAEVAKCRVGTTRTIKRDGKSVVQVCGFTK